MSGIRSTSSADTASRWAGAATTALCYHCLEPIPRFSRLSVNIDGQSHSVCCQGCKAAAEFIAERELTGFYQRRNASAKADNPDRQYESNVVGLDWKFLDDPALQADYVSITQGEVRELSVHVQGVYCSSCSWLINQALEKLSSGIHSRMDINAKRLFLRIDDPAVRLSEVLNTIEKLGYAPNPTALQSGFIDADESTRNERQLALKRIVVAGFGMMQVMTYAVAMYFGDFQGMEETYRRFLSLVSMLVATVVVFYSGRPFFQNAMNDLKNRHLGMDVPIALAIGGAYFPSVYQTLVRTETVGHGLIYFDSAVMFIFFLLLGRYVEMRARHRLSGAPEAISRMLPPFIRVARKIENVIAQLNIKPTEVQPGDVIKLDAGQVLPFDGRVDRGDALLDESMITGESKPVQRIEGDRVVAGSVITHGEIEIESTADWTSSSIARIEQLLAKAHTSGQQEATTLQLFAQYFVAVVLLITCMVATAWWFIAPDRIFEIVLAMLVASCPCAFSLAAPTGATAASHALRLKGLLLTNFEALKVIPNVTTWCFDKTGTITNGRPEITDIRAYGTKDVDQCLQLAATMEQADTHVLSAAFQTVDNLPTADNISRIIGSGVSALIEGEHYYLGKPEWVAGQLPGEHKPDRLIFDDIAGQGTSTVVALADSRHYLASFFIEDGLREQAPVAIRALKDRGLEMSILSGDRSTVVCGLARRLDIDNAEADLLPEQKMQIVRDKQANGEIVAMAGDGVNDAPVIAQADVSVAMANGSEISQSQADVIVLSGSLGSLSTLHKIAAKTRDITRQNLAWALMYNLLVLPLAAVGFLTPWIAALGMSLSSLLVVLNALRIGRVQDSTG